MKPENSIIQAIGRKSNPLKDGLNNYKNLVSNKVSGKVNYHANK